MKIKNLLLRLKCNHITDINCCLWSVYHEYKNIIEFTKIQLPISIATCFGLPFYVRTNNKNENFNYEIEKFHFIHQQFTNDPSLIIGDMVESFPVITTKQNIPVLTREMKSIDRLAELLWKLNTTSLGIFLNELFEKNADSVKIDYNEILLAIQKVSDNCFNCKKKTHF